MKWNSRDPNTYRDYRYKVGDKRTKEKFLWFPKRIKGVTRWLERAKWEEEYCWFDGKGWETSGITAHYFWKGIKWLTI